jgi:uncharacterized OB-fold protein
VRKLPKTGQLFFPQKRMCVVCCAAAKKCKSTGAKAFSAQSIAIA